MAPNTQRQRLRADGISALMALGHKKSEATRMVDLALVNPNIRTVQELIREAYKKQRDGSKKDTKAIASPWAMAYYAYQTGASVTGDDAELVQIARAIGPGLTLEEFEKLAKQIAQLQSRRAALTNRQYQEALWAMPDAFIAQRANPTHYQPLRDASGRPVDLPIEPPPPAAIDNLSPPSAAMKLPVETLRPTGGPATADTSPTPGQNSAPPQSASGNLDFDQLAEINPKSAAELLSLWIREATTGNYNPELAAEMQNLTVAELSELLTHSKDPEDYENAGVPTLTVAELSELLTHSKDPEDYENAGAPPTYNAHATPQDPATAITAMLNHQPAEPPPTTSSTLDQMQRAADAIGVIDQSGLTDLGNAGVSLTRAFTEPGRAGEHLMNAGISAVSAIPIVGDAAKLLKYGSKGSKVADMSRAANGTFGETHAHHVVDLFKGSGNAGAIDNTRAAFDSSQRHAHHSLGTGSGGGRGNGPIDLGPYATGDSGSDGDGSARQAAEDLNTFTGAIESFIEKIVPGGTAIVAIGSAVYERALKPIVDWLNQMDEKSKKMLSDNRHLAAYSGTISAAMQKLDAERFMRDVAKAQDMGGSLSKLAGAQSRYEQSQQDLTGPYKMLSIEIQAFRTEIANYIMKAIDSIDVIGDLIEWWIGSKQGESTDVERSSAILEEYMAQRKL